MGPRRQQHGYRTAGQRTVLIRTTSNEVQPVAPYGSRERRQGSFVQHEGPPAANSAASARFRFNWCPRLFAQVRRYGYQQKVEGTLTECYRTNHAGNTLCTQRSSRQSTAMRRGRQAGTEWWRNPAQTLPRPITRQKGVWTATHQRRE